MKKAGITFLVLLVSIHLFSQNIGINSTGATPNASAMLDIDVSGLSTATGLLIPRVTSAQKTAMNPLPAAAQGLVVYQTDGLQGFYYNTSTTSTPSWNYINPSSASWSTIGNAGTTAGTNFIGTTDAQDLVVKVNNTEYFRFQSPGRIVPSNFNNNLAIGSSTLASNTTGNDNAALGVATLVNNTTGHDNIAIGSFSMYNITTGINNVAIGTYSLETTQTGNNITAVGKNSGYSFNGGSDNSFYGFSSGSFSSGSNNTYLGNSAGSSASGSGNVFIGYNTGTFATVSNKLYIANSGTATPLIYGDFSTNALKINGSLNINNAYTLPTTAGTSNYVLQTNGAGTASWVNPATLSITETDPQVSSTTTNYIPKWNGTTLVDGVIFDNSTNVGIGTTAPAQKLDVAGKIQMQTGAAVGYVPVSDVNGTMTWTDPTTVVGAQAWKLTGNSGTTAGTNFIGTTDAQALMFKVNNQKAGYIDYATPFSTGFGYQALNANTGNSNAAFGYQALLSNTTANSNTAVGYFSIKSNTTGNFNTAVGARTLLANVSGANNSAVGYEALVTSTTGYSNTAIGFFAMRLNTTGYENAAFGVNALKSNTTGYMNAAFGNGSLEFAATAFGNTAMGYKSLQINTIGQNNTAVGYLSMNSTTTGNSNTAVGSNTLAGNTTGGNNTGIGINALLTNATGSNNTAVGYGADVASNNLTNATAIGYNASVAASNSLVLGGTGADAVNVGIGTTVPDRPLTVQGTGVNNELISLKNSAGTTKYHWNLSGGGLNLAESGVADGRIYVKDATGNVGIGTTSPAQKLDVAGKIQMQTGAAVGYVPVSDVNGTMTWTSPATVLSGAATNTLSLSTNTLTSTINGIAATSNAVSGVSNTSATNSLSTTVNGVAGSTVPIINSNTLTNPTNTITSNVNGVAASATVVNTVSNTSSANTINTTVNGIAGSTVPIINSNTLANPTNTLTSTVNGVAATATVVNTVSNSSSANTINTTINGVAGSTVPIINSNTLSLATNTLTSTINGVAATSSAVSSVANSWTQAAGLTTTVNGVTGTITPASGTISNVLGYNAAGAPVYQAVTGLSHNVSNTISGNTISTTVDATTGAAVTVPNIYTADGSLTGNRTVTMAANNLNFNSTTGNLIFNPSSTGYVGIGNTTPASLLDVKGGVSGSVTAPANYIVSVKNTTNNGGAILTNVANNLNAARYIEFEVAGTEVGCLYGNGSNVATLYSASDKRLKTNIRNTALGLTDLMKMKVRDYNWKLDGKQVNAGFIAQELYEVYPEAVLKGSKGELDSKAGGTWMVNYAGITPLIVKSIQDQQEEIKQLMNIITDQNKTITSLQSENKLMNNRLTSVEAEMQQIKAMRNAEALNQK